VLSVSNWSWAEGFMVGSLGNIPSYKDMFIRLND
jgi:hypothetical protein